MQQYNNNNIRIEREIKKKGQYCWEIKKVNTFIGGKKKRKPFLLNSQQFCSKKQQWKYTVSSNVMHYVLKNNLHHWLMQSRCNNVSTLYQFDTKVKKKIVSDSESNVHDFKLRSQLNNWWSNTFVEVESCYFFLSLLAALLTFNAQVRETNSSQVW